MINGIEFYREVSTTSRSYLAGRAGTAFETVNSTLGRHVLDEPHVDEDVMVGYVQVPGLSLRTIAEVAENLTGDKRNTEVALRPEATSFDDEGAHIEGLSLQAGRRLQAKQSKVMNKALKNAGVRPSLILPDMQLVVARFEPDVLTKLRMSQVEPVGETIAHDTGLVYLEGVQARPMDDGSGLHLRAVS